MSASADGKISEIVDEQALYRLLNVLEAVARETGILREISEPAEGAEAAQARKVS